MRTLIEIGIGVSLAIFAVGMIRRALQVKTLKDRCDALCGLPGVETIVVDDPTVDGRIMLLLEKLGVSPRSYAARGYMIVTPLALACAAAFGGWKVGLAFTAALIVAHFLILRWYQNKRAGELLERLPGFLERVRRLVMIGNTLPNAFTEAASTADPVIKAQIDPFVRRIRYGAPFVESIEMLARQNSIVELHMLAAYVKTNARFGGRVAQTLSHLIDQLRNQHRLKREIRAATAETRASATILVALTIFVIVLMGVSNADYMRFFFSSTQGRVIFSCLIGWPCIGMLVMKRILTLDF